ncbi:tripartite tricarboxylate transporter substrate-binding protein [Pseudonocardia sp. NPDC049635]|uniref:Bug family tripartite tricarboxylate transporter substrate binding protein n=1 Tax=Pseudonocardia sp. NPDC049635 TaxID=3155506 RepID=UPI0033DD6AA3
MLAAAALVAVPAVPTLTTAFDPAGAPLHGLRILVPNTPGGGFDVTARSTAKALEDSGIAGPVEVFNLPGNGGVAGLGRTISEAGNERLVMSAGLGVVGAAASRGAPVTLGDTTPIARLVEESEIVVVPGDSPIGDVHALLDAWRADPSAVRFGGGSTPGGPDHLATMALARGAGVDPARVDYLTHDGGGDLLAALLGGEVEVAVSGLGEFADQIDAGDLRVLAVTDGDRVPGVDAPTLREAGVDVEFANWRGVVAPPGLSAEARSRLEQVFARLRDTPEWRATLRTNGWRDAWLPGAEFDRFLAAEGQRVAGLLHELGPVPPS